MYPACSAIHVLLGNDAVGRGDNRGPPYSPECSIDLEPGFNRFRTNAPRGDHPCREREHPYAPDYRPDAPRYGFESLTGCWRRCTLQHVDGQKHYAQRNACKDQSHDRRRYNSRTHPAESIVDRCPLKPKFMRPCPCPPRDRPMSVCLVVSHLAHTIIHPHPARSLSVAVHPLPGGEGHKTP